MTHLTVIKPTTPEPVVRAFRPSIHFDSSQLPAIKNWDVGKTYIITLKIKQTSKHIGEQNQVRGSFDIIAVGATKDKSKDKE